MLLCYIEQVVKGLLALAQHAEGTGVEVLLESHGDFALVMIGVVLPGKRQLELREFPIPATPCASTSTVQDDRDTGKSVGWPG